MPYSMQYNFTVEHTRWDTGFRASYIGTNTRQGDWGYNYQLASARTRVSLSTSRACSPNIPAINYFTNGAGHQYHSLTLEAERQMAQGILRSKLLGVGARHRRPGARRSLRRTRSTASAKAPSGMDIPTHRFTINWIYQFPFGRGKQ